MKKIITAFNVIIMTVLVAGFGLVAEAETRTDTQRSIRGTTELRTGITPEAIKIDARAKTEIDNLIRSESARCNSLANQEQKRTCLAQIELRIKERLPLTTPEDIKMLREKMIQSQRVQENSGSRPEVGSVPKERSSPEFQKVSSRLVAAHDRISTLADRIDSRIRKLESEGVETAEARRYTEAARSDLRMAKSSIATMEENVKTLTGRTSLSGTAEIDASIRSLRETIESIKKNLISAHRNLTGAIASLKSVTNKVAN